MKHRRLLFLLLWLLQLIISPQASVFIAADQPNIVVIMSDDMGYSEISVVTVGKFGRPNSMRWRLAAFALHSFTTRHAVAPLARLCFQESTGIRPALVSSPVTVDCPDTAGSWVAT